MPPKKKPRNHHDSHYHLKDSEQITALENDYNIHYIPTTDSECLAFEGKLKIAPVAMLKTSDEQKTMGVFTTEEINVCPHTIQVLGIYTGDRVDTKKAKARSKSSFVFELPGGEAIDALNNRNWLAMVNSTLSSITANVKVHYNEALDEIEYCFDGGEKGLCISAGMQLLIHYGDKFIYNDNKRFLKPTDTWKNSAEIFADNKINYRSKPKKLDSNDFVALFNIKTWTFFALPLENSAVVDLPFLAYTSTSFECFFSQNEQENITPLMFACWEGNIARIQTLLTAGANPNIQSSITGQSCFHIIVRSSLPVEHKIACINLLCSYSGCLTLQDSDDNSVLHWAIKKTNEVKCITFLIDKEPAILNYTDGNDCDAFELAIMHGDNSVIAYFLDRINTDQKTMQDKTLDYYLLQDDTNTLGSSRLVSAFNVFAQNPSNDAHKKYETAVLIICALKPLLNQKACEWQMEMGEIEKFQLSLTPALIMPAAQASYGGSSFFPIAPASITMLTLSQWKDILDFIENSCASIFFKTSSMLISSFIQLETIAVIMDQQFEFFIHERKQLTILALNNTLQEIMRSFNGTPPITRILTHQAFLITQKLKHWFILQINSQTEHEISHTIATIGQGLNVHVGLSILTCAHFWFLQEAVAYFSTEQRENYFAKLRVLTETIVRINPACAYFILTNFFKAITMAVDCSKTILSQYLEEIMINIIIQIADHWSLLINEGLLLDLPSDILFDTLQKLNTYFPWEELYTPHSSSSITYST